MLINTTIAHIVVQKWTEGKNSMDIYSGMPFQEGLRFDDKPPKIRHGKWRKTHGGYYYCSVCEVEIKPDCDIEDVWYCPHCNAKMYGVEE